MDWTATGLEWNELKWESFPHIGLDKGHHWSRVRCDSGEPFINVSLSLSHSVSAVHWFPSHKPLRYYWTALYCSHLGEEEEDQIGQTRSGQKGRFSYSRAEGREQEAQRWIGYLQKSTRPTSRRRRLRRRHWYQKTDESVAAAAETWLQCATQQHTNTQGHHP